MATNEVLIKTGTEIVLANSGEYVPTGGNSLGTRTDQIDLDGLAALAARQSAKVDFLVTRAARLTMSAAIEYATAPAAAETVDFYIAFSANVTAGTGNPGGVSGSDSAYTGYSSNLTDSLRQLTRIGSMPLTVQATTTVQIATLIGVFTPLERFGTIVVVNNSAADAFVADAVEMAVRIAPAIDEIQAAS